VLTSETLRNEVVDLYTGKTTPVNTILMVTHSISEGVFMATRLVVMGAHPGSIRAVLDNALPYPRDEHHPEFLALIQKLHALITQAVFPAEPAPAIVPGIGRLPIEAIPNASLSSTIGLLEMLENEGGMELFELAGQAHVELSQLLLVVKAAEMSGWVTAQGGLVELAAAGRQFLAADIKARKQLLNASLRGLFVFDLIVQALKQSARNEVDEAVILDQLARALPHEQAPRILQTVVAWARYAELFKYSSIRRVFYGLQQPR
jgi:NitT/TauT family transport system ATP-binding protein